MALYGSFDKTSKVICKYYLASSIKMSKKTAYSFFAVRHQKRFCNKPNRCNPIVVGNTKMIATSNKILKGYISKSEISEQPDTS